MCCFVARLENTNMVAPTANLVLGVSLGAGPMVLLCYAVAAVLLRPSEVGDAGNLWGHTPSAAIPWYGLSAVLAAGAMVYLLWWTFRLAGPGAKVFSLPLYRSHTEVNPATGQPKVVGASHPPRGEWVAAGILLTFLLASAVWLPLAAWVRARVDWDVLTFTNVLCLAGPLVVAGLAAILQMAWVTHPGSGAGLSKTGRIHRRVAFAASIFVAFHVAVLDGTLFPLWWFKALPL